jgi:plastocyanin
MHTSTRPTRAALFAAAVLVAACGPAPREPSRTHEVRLVTDERGNYFDPEEVVARPGDRLRFRLTSGVHNVHLVAAEGAVVPELPAASALLQRPGDALEIPVDVPPGEYRFQCDPHSGLGMVGKLTVR